MFHYFLNKNFKYKKKGFKHKYTTNIKLRYSAAFVLAYLSLHNSTHFTLCTSSRRNTSAFFIFRCRSTPAHFTSFCSFCSKLCSKPYGEKNCSIVLLLA